MNLEIFEDGTVSGKRQEWFEITTELADLEATYRQILYELKEYEGQCSDDAVIIQDNTIIMILTILKKLISEDRAKDELLLDLMKLTEG